MEQYVQNIRIKQWTEIIKAANESGVPRMQWLKENNITKDAFYYIYKYETWRSADCTIIFLDKFKGYLECDAYGAYRKLGRVNPDITFCSCWAHARQSFSDAVKAYWVKAAGVHDTLAYRALEKIALIYSADEKLKQYPPEERLKRRKTTVKRKVDDFFIWAKQHQTDTGCKDLTWEGFSYCINNEDYLRRFLCDGEIPIDNSASERAMDFKEAVGFNPNDKWDKENLVFVDYTGEPVHPDSVTDWFSNLAQKYPGENLPHLHPHAFRHSVATALIFERVDLVSVAKTLGHKDATTTAKIYAHAIDAAVDLNAENF